MATEEPHNRKGGIELLRIAAMLMVITLHVLGPGGGD